jgi:septal ring factor EnvC (AmiA/AmiB activator)
MENWIQVISLFVATSIMMGAMFKFMWDRLDKKFDLLAQEIKEIKADIKEIKASLQSLEMRIGRLETQDEERFRNEIKLLVKERSLQ